MEEGDATAMKITGITAVGSYPSYWLEYCISSVYNCVDEIVVVNGGLDDVVYPRRDDAMLKRESAVLRQIDKDNKIIEIKPSWDIAPPQINNKTSELRARNLSIATQIAHERGADWILKFDSDQVLYPTVKDLRVLTLCDSRGYQFWQMPDFIGDVYHINDGYQNRNPFDDGVKFYKAHLDVRYGGQGAIIGAVQTPCDGIQSAHFRRIVPENISERDKKDFFFRRAYYHIWSQNIINEHPVNQKEGRKLQDSEMLSMALQEAESHMKEIGSINIRECTDLINIPPLACLMKPLEYITGGYPL